MKRRIYRRREKRRHARLRQQINRWKTDVLKQEGRQEDVDRLLRLFGIDELLTRKLIALYPMIGGPAQTGG